MPPSEDQNLVMLKHDLTALRLAESFHKTFKVHAAANAIIIPIAWNSHDIFIARLKTTQQVEAQILPFEHFLCTPLLVHGDDKHRYKKYCGNRTACSNSDSISEVLSAFTHHTYIQSSGTTIFADFQGISQPNGNFILFDPQFHSLNKFLQGQTWNDGLEGIKSIVTAHKCSAYCCRLNLVEKDMVFPFIVARPLARPNHKPCTPAA